MRKRKIAQFPSEDESAHLFFSDSFSEKKKVQKKGGTSSTNLVSKLQARRKEQFPDSKLKYDDQSASRDYQADKEQFCSKCTALKNKIEELEEDQKQLSNQIGAMNDLQSLVGELRHSLSGQLCPQNLTSPSRPIPSATASPSASSFESISLDSDSSNETVLIGEDVKVNRTLLQRCNHSQPTKLVCDLLALTGQRASSKEVVKPPLNTKKVNAIFAYTLSKFPTVPLKELTGAARNKLNNQSKLYRKPLTGKLAFLVNVTACLF
ncbi:hypothetical protein AOXY_G34927 [Acipenser oxyrinchus oxyrinchus]|uniref:BEN domain-containing protein n=1 Tax=Acipenser oxyrinchus oxyrinchus TaxID=40147 RepID=A0AAD8CH48_ACIOX|nr:hypothetical protein AOXY_G35610 [Acipenser oxyrinchus oxyrinchus]KAK1148894.1 hypothetical protein AOXY_G34927 [Acipenser oxyrinchus oxyrinchus]